MEAVVPSDIVLKTTALFTAEELEPRAGCVAVRGSEIVAVGSPDKVQPFIGPDTEVIDAGNKLVMPGFNDSHMHFALGSIQKDEDFCCDRCSCRVSRLAWMLWQSLLPNTLTIRGFTARVGIRLHGKTRLTLIAAASMHSISTAQSCFRIFRCTWCGAIPPRLGRLVLIANTPTPEGGLIRHFDNGEPNGFLSEPQATNILLDVVLNKPDLDASLLKSMRKFNKLGITSIGDMYPLGVTTPGVYDIYDRLASEDLSTLRISYYSALDAPMSESQALRVRHHGERVRMAGLKYILDGCPEAYTAYMHEPYLNAPTGKDFRGEPACNQETLDRMMLEASKNGFDVRIHAIGDASATMIIDAVERAEEVCGNKGGAFCYRAYR